VNGKGIIKRLKADGWIVLRQEGSHIRMGKGAARTTVPVHGTRDIKSPYPGKHRAPDWHEIQMIGKCP